MAKNQGSSVEIQGYALWRKLKWEKVDSQFDVLTYRKVLLLNYPPFIEAWDGLKASFGGDSVSQWSHFSIPLFERDWIARVELSSNKKEIVGFDPAKALEPSVRLMEKREMLELGSRRGIDVLGFRQRPAMLALDQPLEVLLEDLTHIKELWDAERAKSQDRVLYEPETKSRVEEKNDPVENDAKLIVLYATGKLNQVEIAALLKYKRRKILGQPKIKRTSNPD